MKTTFYKMFKKALYTRQRLTMFQYIPPRATNYVITVFGFKLRQPSWKHYLNTQLYYNKDLSLF